MAAIAGGRAKTLPFRLARRPPSTPPHMSPSYMSTSYPNVSKGSLSRSVPLARASFPENEGTSCIRRRAWQDGEMEDQRRRRRDRAPLCPAGHLPHLGRDRIWRWLSPTAGLAGKADRSNCQSPSLGGRCPAGPRGARGNSAWKAKFLAPTKWGRGGSAKPRRRGGARYAIALRRRVDSAHPRLPPIARAG